MKCRILLLISVPMLFIQGLSYAQESSNVPSQIGGFRHNDNTSEKDLETKIFFLEFTQAHEMLNILSTVSQKARIAVAESTNALLITAPSAELETMRAVIAALDVSKRSRIQSQPLMCRVYMIEHLSRSQSWKTFNLDLMIYDEISASQILDSFKVDQLQIERFTKNNSEGNTLFRFQGQAAPDVDIEKLAKTMIPECEIRSFNCNNKTSLNPTVTFATLPESLQNHINRLLGKDTEIAGYWFGNLSVPGEIRAPIGPWTLEFEMNPLGTDGLIGLDLSVEEVRGDEVWTIIRNSMQTRIGHPVIIGYTREKDGISTTGALVVIPEPMPKL